jgi:hypothetical protein
MHIHIFVYGLLYIYGLIALLDSTISLLKHKEMFYVRVILDEGESDKVSGLVSKYKY